MKSPYLAQNGQADPALQIEARFRTLAEAESWLEKHGGGTILQRQPGKSLPAWKAMNEMSLREYRRREERQRLTAAGNTVTSYSEIEEMHPNVSVYYGEWRPGWGVFDFYIDPHGREWAEEFCESDIYDTQEEADAAVLDRDKGRAEAEQEEADFPQAVRT